MSLFPVKQDISLEGLHEETEVFMFAGHDTTTTTLCYTLGFITENDHIYRKCVDETNRVYGTASRNTGFIPSYFESWLHVFTTTGSMY